MSEFSGGPTLHLFKLLAAACLYAFPAKAEVLRFSCDRQNFEIDIQAMRISVNGMVAERPRLNWNGAWFSFTTPETDIRLYHPLMRAAASYADNSLIECQQHEKPDLRGLPFPEYPAAEAAYLDFPVIQRNAIQNALKREEYYAGGIDGEWGPGMRRAMSDLLIRYQLGSCRAPDLSQQDVARALFSSVVENNFELELPPTGWSVFDGCDAQSPTEQSLQPALIADESYLDIEDQPDPRMVSQKTLRLEDQPVPDIITSQLPQAPTATSGSIETPETRAAAISAAYSACARESTVFGLCWKQTEEQRSIALGERHFHRNSPDKNFDGPDGAFIAWDADTMTFSCGVFDVCNLGSEEVLSLISTEYEIVDVSMHSEKLIYGQSIGPCVKLATGESICVVEMVLDGDRSPMATGGQQFVLFKRGTAGKPPISFR